MDINALIKMSRRYGTAEYALAGGGNTSYKKNNAMLVKCSGSNLKTISAEQFTAMDLIKLGGMFEKEYPSDDGEREAEALRDMTAARLPGEEDKRPSVEAPLHGLFTYAYVLHVHPALVNGMTCGRGGEKICRELFGDSAVWIPVSKPGYTLAAVCKEAFFKSEKNTGVFPKLAFLQNHGIFVAADTTDEIDSIMSEVADKLSGQLISKPDLTEISYDRELACKIAPAIRMLYSPNAEAAVVFTANKLTERFTADGETMRPLMKPFTPDHIVYCRDEPLFMGPDDDYGKKFGAFLEEKGYPPGVVAVRGLGVFAAGKNINEARASRDLFIDAMKVAVYAESFGGYLPMKDDIARFIAGWEAEKYRRSAAFTAVSKKRLNGKIAAVTGAAQGIGKNIAEALASEGACVVIADLNISGAEILAEEINKKYGELVSAAVKTNVADEKSVKEMIETAVLNYGGLDILISNAGVLIAGGLDEMTKEKFELVTGVNYTGYFLCAKHAAVPMKIQRKYSPSYTADIIEINSKSGLRGSNKNFAYAGGKFGGIGLTQSFALELVEFGIKVNAVCPGNMLDGPLWSDPEKGLFRQYLDAGKVPGAKTVADVRAFYEAMVPMKRGCRAEDIIKAVFYAIEQQYETGQAIPVTGGQVMLS